MPTARINGFATKTQPDRTSAPRMPPSSDAVNEALRARAAWPCRAKGKPSRIVAEDEPPGIPMRIDGKVSPVAVVASMPIISASAEVGSMP
jgi:hypothetical protein